MGGQTNDQQNDKQRESFVRRPNRDIRLRTSKDGRYFLVDIIETWFFPVHYVATIAANAGKSRPKAAASRGEAEEMEQ